MKYILFIILSFGIYAKDIKISYDWSCQRVDFGSKTMTLPKSEKIKIRYDISTKSVSIEPDIFNQVSFSEVDSFANSDSCIANMIKAVDKSVKSFIRDCSNCEFTKGEVVGAFNRKVFSSQFYNATKKLQKLPRVYLGHTNYSSNLNSSLVNKVCRSQKLDADEIISIVGIQFVKLMTKEIQANKDAFDKSCIEKLVTIQNKFRPDDLFCETSSCKSLLLDTNAIDKDIRALKDAYQVANRSTDEKNLIQNGFRPSSEVMANHFKTKVIRPSRGKYDCNTDYRMPTSVPNYSRQSIFEYDDAIAGAIDTEIAQMPKHCIQSFIRSYINQKEMRKDADNPICTSEYCKERIALYHDNIQRLLSLDHTEEQKEYFCKNINSIDTSYDSFSKLWDEIDEVGRCTELKVGETRVLDFDSSKKNVSHYHSVKKVSDNEYKATLAVEFNTDDSAKNKEYFDKVKECIASTSEYFKSPDGTSMSVDIISKEENDNLPRGEKLNLVDIGLQGKGARSHSRAYAADIDCPTITHEVLHLMGLADEYHENVDKVYYNEETKEAYHEDYFPKSKDKKNYKTQIAYNDCRAISKTPSVMSSQNAMFRDSVKEKVTCECKSDSCKSFMQNEKIAKISIFDPIDYNSPIRNFCKNDRIKVTSVTSPDQVKITGEYYQKVKSTQNSLSFEYDYFENSSKYGKAQLYKMKWSCNCTTDECRELISDYKKENINKNNPVVRSHCPYQTVSKPVDNSVVSASAYGYKSEGDGKFSFITTPKNDSLLHAGQFEKLVWGSCSTKATRYNKCTSYHHGLIAFQCKDRPSYCDSDEGWLTSAK